ncbi:hypothetical protein GCM10010486_42890 [Nonomuraea roseoviolacea subsp. carminata]
MTAVNRVKIVRRLTTTSPFYHVVFHNAEWSSGNKQSEDRAALSTGTPKPRPRSRSAVPARGGSWSDPGGRVIGTSSGALTCRNAATHAARGGMGRGARPGRQKVAVGSGREPAAGSGRDVTAGTGRAVMLMT